MSLLDFMKAAEAEKPEGNEEQAALEKTEVTSETEEQEVPVEDVAQEEEPPAEEPESKQPEDSEVKGLRNWLAKAGYDPEEIAELDDEEVSQHVMDRLRGGNESPDPATEGKAAQSATDGEQTAPPSPAPKQEAKGATEKTSVESELEKLEYDRRIAELVKQEGNKYVPVDESPEAAEAAKIANSYVAKRRERLEKIVDDPRGTLQPLFEELIERKLQERFEAFQKSQEEMQALALAEQRNRSEQERLQALVTENESMLYKLDESGKRRVSLKTNKLMLTKFGKEVERQFMELAEISPNQPQSVLLQKAIKDVSRYMKPDEPVEEKPKAAPAEKKREFLEKAKAATVDTEVSKKPASVQETVELGAGMTLLDAIANDPDNQDNPAVQAIRMRMAR